MSGDERLQLALRILRYHVFVILAIGLLLLAAHGLPIVGEIFKAFFNRP